MKKLLKGICIFALVATGIRAATNKTFFLPRPHGVNLAMEYTTWNELLQTKDEDRFGAHFQLVPFYMDSTDDDDLGRYFGILDKHHLKTHGAAAAAGFDFDWRRIINVHDALAADQFTLTFDPEQTAYGVRIDYYQDLRKILKGLYFKVALPIVHVENDMQMKVTDKAGRFAVAATANDVENYFKGNLPLNVGGLNVTPKLAALTHAKINGQQSTTGVADIDVVLGYKVLNKEKYHLGLNIGLTIPVGDDADGVWVFEPIVGNGDHWALGGGLDFGAKLWDDDDQNIKLTAALNYRYLFESSERRTIGIKNFAGNVDQFGQYRVLADATANMQTAAFAPFPAANLLTTSVDVEPGHQLDAILALAYNNGGFNLDLGYNLFWKDSESVHLKGDPLSGGTYAVLLEGIASNAGARVMNANEKVGGRNITSADLDAGAAATPSQVTHKIYGGIGYIFKDWEYPLMLGLAGHYEFACDDGIENWGIWAKIGIAV